MSTKRRAITVADFSDVMEAIAPTALAQSGDNVGLLAGDRAAPVARILLCIDLTPAVVDEAVRARANLVMAYHPPIYQPISALRVPSLGTDAAVFRCIRAGIAIYSPHTALDAAEGGTNDVMAGLCGVVRTEPLEYVDDPMESEVKLTVFVPAPHVDQVADALFGAGAGRIGDYSRCSYRLGGQGTFLGGESTHPTIGRRGRMERVDEVRLEVVVPTRELPAAVQALRRVHPYEEPAFDIYPLRSRPVPGIGRQGRLDHPTTVRRLARKLRRATSAEHVQCVGPPDRAVERAIIVVGAAGRIPFRIPLTPKDVIITGEIRHHDALAIERAGCSAIALGHWASERPVLGPLARRLTAALPGIKAKVSVADRDPFRQV